MPKQLTIDQLTNVSKAAKINMLSSVLTAIVGLEKMQEYKRELVNLTFFMSSGSSKNKKTGKVNQFYGHLSTCPLKDCIFYKTGACYARNGHCKLWFNVASGKAVKVAKKDEYKILCQPISDLKKRVENIPAGSLYRINVSGDICYKNTGEINAAYVTQLAQDMQGLKAYTYTHAAKTENNFKILKAVNDAGLTINVSCENTDQVKSALAAGIPAVLAVEKMSAPAVKKDGVNYIQCLAQSRGLNCETCGACQRAS